MRHYGPGNRKRSRYDDPDRSEDEEDMFAVHYVNKAHRKEIDQMKGDFIHRHFSKLSSSVQSSRDRSHSATIREQHLIDLFVVTHAVT